MIALEIGIYDILAKCERFNNWIAILIQKFHNEVS
jgi:hypothetical protein